MGYGVIAACAGDVAEYPGIPRSAGRFLRNSALDKETRIAVVGLGYVGLPLAVALAKHFQVTGFDVKADRVAELRNGHDRTHEISDAEMAAAELAFTTEVGEIAGSDVYIVAVPTPVTSDNEPDLGAVVAASCTVGSVLRPGAIVVFESTVYPGVTEEECGPLLEQASGLTCGKDFFLGYSPERINPGDKEHTVDRITKIVAGQTPEVTTKLARMYGAMNGDRIFEARDIKTAEAAKVIENAQRDINIAFVNEVAMILNRQGLSVYDVLEAAGTKWNFLPFRPGLVGGHCIGVDPYYLAHLAEALGYNPEIILSGRRINDAMGGHIAQTVVTRVAATANGRPARVLVLGLTFKENVPDLRNSKVIDIIMGLRAAGVEVAVHDAHADGAEAKAHYGVELIGELPVGRELDAVVGAVPHDAYRGLDGAVLGAMVRPGGLIADVKGMWRDVDLPDGVRRWQL